MRVFVVVLVAALQAVPALAQQDPVTCEAFPVVSPPLMAVWMGRNPHRGPFPRISGVWITTMISGQTVGMAQASETPSESRRHADSLALVGVDGGGTDQLRGSWLEFACTGSIIG